MIQGQSEASPQQVLPEFSDDQKILIGSTLLTDLGFASVVDQEVTFAGTTMTAGKFLTHPACFAMAFPMIVNYKQLERAQQDADEASIEAFQKVRRQLTTRFGSMFGIEVDETTN